MYWFLKRCRIGINFVFFYIALNENSTYDEKVNIPNSLDFLYQNLKNSRNAP